MLRVTCRSKLSVMYIISFTYFPFAPLTQYVHEIYSRAGALSLSLFSFSLVYCFDGYSPKSMALFNSCYHELMTFVMMTCGEKRVPVAILICSVDWKTKCSSVQNEWNWKAWEREKGQDLGSIQGLGGKKSCFYYLRKSRRNLSFVASSSRVFPGNLPFAWGNR